MSSKWCRKASGIPLAVPSGSGLSSNSCARTTMASASWWRQASGPVWSREVGIYFRNTLSSRNRKYWVKMQTEPQKWVEWIIRGDGDDVDSLMRAYPQAFTDFEVVDQGTFQREGSFKIYELRK